MVLLDMVLNLVMVLLDMFNLDMVLNQVMVLLVMVLMDMLNLDMEEDIKILNKFKFPRGHQAYLHR